MWSAELESLDQLCGEDLPLSVVRQLFRSDDHFRHAILAMLHERDVLLSRANDTEPLDWERRALLSDPTHWAALRLSITRSGAKRMT